MSRKTTGQDRLWQDRASQNAIDYSNAGNLTGESESIFDGNTFVTFGPRDFLGQKLLLQFGRFLRHGQEKRIV
jgi:hypothetical protein